VKLVITFRPKYLIGWFLKKNRMDWSFQCNISPIRTMQRYNWEGIYYSNMWSTISQLYFFSSAWFHTWQQWYSKTLACLVQITQQLASQSSHEISDIFCLTKSFFSFKQCISDKKWYCYLSWHYHLTVTAAFKSS